MNKILVFALVLLTACGTGKNTANDKESDKKKPEPIAFEYISLKLTGLRIETDLEKTGEVEITLYIDVVGNTYSGKSGCNNYFGSLEKVDDDKLLFKMGGSTEMMCADNLMTWEDNYMKSLLGKPFKVFSNKTNATLTSEDNSIVLSFKRVSILQE